MTRTLPWLRGAGPGASSNSTADTSRRVNNSLTNTPVKVPKRRRLSTPSSGDDLNTTGVSTPQRKARFGKIRTPSTSPPPAPPEQEPMREGYTADDIWIMVEDEFLSTAHLFTQHLHHAEYQRLKKQAKEREVNSISRPVESTTAMPAQTKQMMNRSAQDSKVAAGMSKIARGADSNEDDDPWLRDPVLGSLMESPRKPARMLKSMGAGRSNTKAFAGYAGVQETLSRDRSAPRESTLMQPEPQVDVEVRKSKARVKPYNERSTNYDNDDDDDDDEEDDDDDDLDQPVKTTITKSAPSHPSLSARSQVNSRDKQTHEQPPASHTTRHATKKPLPGTARRSAFKFDSFDDPPEDNLTVRPSSEVATTNARRKGGVNAAKKESKADEEKSKKTDSTREIPTFLF